MVLTGTGRVFSAGVDFDHHFPMFARGSLAEVHAWFAVDELAVFGRMLDKMNAAPVRRRRVHLDRYRDPGGWMGV